MFRGMKFEPEAETGRKRGFFKGLSHCIRRKDFMLAFSGPPVVKGSFIESAQSIESP